VIDGSTDSSLQVLEAWKGKLPLRIIARRENLGRTATLNEGFTAATHDFLVRCDDDLVVKDDFVQKYFDLLSSHPGSGIIGPYLNSFPKSRYASVYGEKASLRHRSFMDLADKSEKWKFWAGNVGFTREMWNSVGDYDTQFREYGWEDVDWGFRLKSAGYKIEVREEVSATHLLAAVNCELRAERAYFSGKAKSKFERKHELQPEKIGSGLWNGLVKIGMVIDHKLFAKALDLTLAFLPSFLADKLISLCVQISFMQGHKSSKNASNESNERLKA
jgi:GT2 family glycosyltransferase